MLGCFLPVLYLSKGLPNFQSTLVVPKYPLFYSDVYTATLSQVEFNFSQGKAVFVEREVLPQPPQMHESTILSILIE